MTELRRARDIDAVWSVLIDVYAEVRKDQLHDPHYSVERYAERLARHGSEAGWETVIAYEDGAPVGYGYVNSLTPDDRWWKRTTPAPAADVTGTPTVAVKEMVVIERFRRRGIAKLIHDRLLAGRDETSVTLMVSPANENGRVQALYARWGYQVIGRSQPSPDSPPLTVMLRPLDSGNDK
ncbi:GNAT family N-acetyltransferase [Streptomyces luteolus]|uniref:GNAT family N-acetyltransferase n=1 Tax=Streptomyces luteolus TaxID=3043615 RepID=A0ABT6T4V4_9ACTN|nr:GNAT family N-acetyltransferase [Streptomyces sp. B-S-A12]MDI3422897.1 GNAT family N-acetyltransferase [Streptomyces sp. B-S-A12]